MKSTQIALEQLSNNSIWGVNVTEALTKDGINQIVVSVWDEQSIGGESGLMLEWIDSEGRTIESDVYLSVSELAGEFGLDVTSLKSGLLKRLIENLQSPSIDEKVMTSVGSLDDVKLFLSKLRYTKP